MECMNDKNSTIYIRAYEPSDAEALLALHLNNREFFQTYNPARDEAFYTLETQLANIGNGKDEWNQDKRYPFGIFLKETGELIGDISLFEVKRGPLQKCMLGYSLDQRHNGKGYMSEAVRLVVEFAFKEAGLHRIEAGASPRNAGSLRVLEKAGFRSEGLARKNVKINGIWEDHQMYSLLDEDVLK
ncbi:ribosomal-protein-alanine N-acetyltransferase [Paenibacillus tianmuensis]|uniref:Ribosomal-protein-alanine N-acetyltransferase n=2 Tax=Paenibacillus tianmuensis TaxID=624147 RepID=A0A1G4QI45_9BACL|nr:GNAT family protein [Paenibacillus tianmuensis]SCW44280.1 ribosomal-protein-alanine N-acetyltransferase [Paenibacillus tianmuensis]